MGRSSGTKGGGLISRLLWFGNLTVGFALLASYLSAYVNPLTTTIFAFLGLAYHYILALNILFALFWLIRGRRKLLLSVIVILIGYNPFIHHFQIMPGREAPKESALVKVMSYNVQNMAHSNIGQRDPETRRKIYDFIGSQKADIACLQEFASKENDTAEVFRTIKSLTGFSQCFNIDYNPGDYHINALLILSKLPYFNPGTLSLPGEKKNFGGYIDILFQGDTTRVYNLHLESIRLHHEDLQFVEDVTKGQTEQSQLGEASKSILRKLHYAYKTRARQSSVVRESLDHCPYPVIICGDFNDTPLSYAYHQISKDLKDSFVNAGYGLGNTFAGNLPPIRIDFIFHSLSLTSYEFKVHTTGLSDHYPVSVYLGK